MFNKVSNCLSLTADRRLSAICPVTYHLLYTAYYIRVG